MAPESAEGSPAREQRNVIVFLTGIFFFNMISRLGFGPLMPVIETDLNINHSQAGGFFFFISSGYCISLFGSIFLTPVFSHRRLIIASSLAVGTSLLVAAASQKLFMLQISLVLLGLAGGFYLPSGVASLTGLVRKKDWGKVLGFHQLAPNLAYILAPLAAEFFLAWQSWRMVLVVYGFASLMLAAGYARWGKGVSGHTDPPELKVFTDMVREPSLLIIAALFVLGMGLNQGVFVILPLYLHFERGFDPGWANFLLALSRTVAFGFPLAGGWLADRFGVRQVLLTAFIFVTLGTFLLVFLPNAWLWIALMVQAGASVCILPLCFAMMAMVTTPGNRAIAVSVVVPLAHFLGSGMVPLGVGFLAEAGYFNLGFLGLGGLTLLSLPLVLCLNKIRIS